MGSSKDKAKKRFKYKNIESIDSVFNYVATINKGLKTRKLGFGNDDDMIEMEMPNDVELLIDAETRKGKGSLQITVNWETPAPAGASDDKKSSKDEKSKKDKKSKKAKGSKSESSGKEKKRKQKPEDDNVDLKETPAATAGNAKGKSKKKSLTPKSGKQPTRSTGRKKPAAKPNKSAAGKKPVAKSSTTTAKKAPAAKKPGARKTKS